MLSDPQGPPRREIWATLTREQLKSKEMGKSPQGQVRGPSPATEAATPTPVSGVLSRLPTPSLFQKHFLSSWVLRTHTGRVLILKPTQTERHPGKNTHVRNANQNASYNLSKECACIGQATPHLQWAADPLQGRL